MRKRRDETKIKNIARERIARLFGEAKKAFSEDANLSNRYVQLARKIAMKARIRVPRELKRRFCKHCYSYLVPSKNCRVRTHEGKVVYYCFNCKKYMRYPYLKKKKDE